jgi:hypothetical protein
MESTGQIWTQSWQSVQDHDSTAYSPSNSIIAISGQITLQTSHLTQLAVISKYSSIGIVYNNYHFQVVINYNDKLYERKNFVENSTD